MEGVGPFGRRALDHEGVPLQEQDARGIPRRPLHPFTLQPVETTHLGGQERAGLARFRRGKQGRAFDDPEKGVVVVHPVKEARQGGLVRLRVGRRLGLFDVVHGILDKGADLGRGPFQVIAEVPVVLPLLVVDLEQILLDEPPESLGDDGDGHAPEKLAAADLDEAAVEQIPLAERLCGGGFREGVRPVGKDVPDLGPLSRFDPLNLVHAQDGTGITLQDLPLQRGELVFPAVQVQLGKGLVVFVRDEVQRVPGEEPGELLLALEVVVEFVFVVSVNAAPLKVLVEGEFVLLVKPVGIGKAGKPVVEIGNDPSAAGEIVVDDPGNPAFR